MKKTIIILISLINLCGFNALAQEEEHQLIVKVENIKKIKGSIKIALYNQEKEFLSNDVVMSGDKAVKESSVEFVFKDVPKGVYAISLFHDENGNDEFDTNLFGIPTEPYAFSNNAKGMFGPPSFDECSFTIHEVTHEVVISL